MQPGREMHRRMGEAQITALADADEAEGDNHSDSCSRIWNPTVSKTSFGDGDYQNSARKP
jgi:hypothetical protein